MQTTMERQGFHGFAMNHSFSTMTSSNDDWIIEAFLFSASLKDIQRYLTIKSCKGTLTFESIISQL